MTTPATTLLLRLHRARLTLPEALLLYEVARRQEAGESTIIRDLCTALGMPVNSVSRHAWNLALKKFVRYEPVPGDRRAKALMVCRRSMARLEGRRVQQTEDAEAASA